MTRGSVWFWMIHLVSLIQTAKPGASRLNFYVILFWIQASYMAFKMVLNIFIVFPSLKQLKNLKTELFAIYTD